MSDKKKKKTWLKFRHRVVYLIARPVVWLMCLTRFHVKIRKPKGMRRRQCVVLYNHQTPYDQFFVALAFFKPVYFVATEDIFSLGRLSRLLQWAVEPIPFRKATTDIKAVRACFQVADEGGIISIAPEGNRTYSGHTGYMNPSIASLVQKLKLPLAIFQIRGGYGMEPRWSSVTRKGTMEAGVTRWIEPEEYKDMSRQAFYEMICRELQVDEAESAGTYESPYLAEHLERAFYTCPSCGLAEWKSSGAEAECCRCGKKIRYGADKRICGVETDFPYQNAGEWYDAQESFIRGLDLNIYLDEDRPAFRDEGICMQRVIPYEKKKMVCEKAQLRLYGDRITLESPSAIHPDWTDEKIAGKEGAETEALVFRFSDLTAAAVCGRNKLQLITENSMYQFTGEPGFNALKYVHFYYHACGRKSDSAKGENYVEFLGL